MGSWVVWVLSLRVRPQQLFLQRASRHSGALTALLVLDLAVVYNPSTTTNANPHQNRRD